MSALEIKKIVIVILVAKKGKLVNFASLHCTSIKHSSGSIFKEDHFGVHPISVHRRTTHNHNRLRFGIDDMKYFYVGHIA